jgi:hypothetical protein
VSGTTFHRTKKERNYSVIDNTILKDSRASFRAKGLMCYLLSLPEDWKIYLKEIQNHVSDGKDSLSSAITELENLGYLKKELNPKIGGRFSGYSFEIIESPIISEQPVNIVTEEHINNVDCCGNTASVSPHLLSTNKQSTNTVSNIVSKDTILSTGGEKDEEPNNIDNTIIGNTSKKPPTPFSEDPKFAKLSKFSVARAKPGKKTLTNLIANYTDDEKLRNALELFLNHFRQLSRQQFPSCVSFESMLLTLTALSEQYKKDKYDIVMGSIERNWKGFYVQEDFNPPGCGGNKSSNGVYYPDPADRSTTDEQRKAIVEHSKRMATEEGREEAKKGLSKRVY